MRGEVGTLGEEVEAKPKSEEMPQEMVQIEAKEAKNVKWILIVSLAIFIFTFYTMTHYVYYPYPFIAKDFWYYLNLVNALFLILTIMFSSLYLADFWNKDITYTATAYTFIISMLSLFVMFLRPLF